MMVLPPKAWCRGCVAISNAELGAWVRQCVGSRGMCHARGGGATSRRVSLGKGVVFHGTIDRGGA